MKKKKKTTANDSSFGLIGEVIERRENGNFLQSRLLGRRCGEKF